jgi:UMF1 family MFS transporter
MADVSTAVLNNPKTVRAWYMFDWANSVYTLVITTAIFPIYYKGVIPSQVSFLGLTFNNSDLYSYALSFSFFIVALILPFLSGVADYSGNKKSFMRVFVWMGSVSCMGLFFFSGESTLWLGLLLSILASIGYSGSLVFYDAFLPEIVTEDRYDATSARGYSMGYYGSVILMVACLIMIMNAPSFGFPNDQEQATALATRCSFVLVGLWWLGFSYIPFTILPDNPFHRKPKGNIWLKGYAEIRKVWRSLKHQSNLKRFLTAFFFYNMGVQTVMYLATLFGTDVLHLEADSLIMVVVIIQLVGAIGAWFFARLSQRLGNRSVLLIMITIWIVVCICASQVQTALQFYGLAFVVGLVMGGIQSLSRATYSKLIPSNTIDHTSYFSFYDVTYNVSIFLGTFTFGFVNQLTGSMRYSAMALAVFFVIGLLFLLTVNAKGIHAVPLAEAEEEVDEIQ